MAMPGSDEWFPVHAFDGNRQLVVDGMMGSDSLGMLRQLRGGGLNTVRFRGI